MHEQQVLFLHFPSLISFYRMKTDLYTKGVLTAIALCLVIQVFQSAGFPTANASPVLSAPALPTGYALIPVNPDGSINVVVKGTSGTQDVVIAGWRNSEGKEKPLYSTESLPVRTTNP